MIISVNNTFDFLGVVFEWFQCVELQEMRMNLVLTLMISNWTSYAFVFHTPNKTNFLWK